MTVQRTKLQKNIIAIHYEDTRLLIVDTIHQYIKSFGGCFHELFSLSNEVFMKAWDKHDDNGPASFPTYLRRLLWNAFIDHSRKVASRLKYVNRMPRINGTEIEVDFEQPNEDSFLNRFTDVLSADAFKFLTLLLYPPKSIRRKIEHKPGSIQTRKIWVSDLLMHREAWTQSQAANAISEISFVWKNQNEIECAEAE